MGVNPKNILITEIGRPVEISENSARLGNPVPSADCLSTVWASAMSALPFCATESICLRTAC